MTQTIHATTVSLNGMGVLLRGAPGSGKSSLALQLIEQPGSGLGSTPLAAQLVADDQTVLDRHGDKLMASAPEALKGLLELRGLGLVRVPHVQNVPVTLIVDLQSSSGIERLPEQEQLRLELLGVVLSRVAIDASHPSAAARVRSALVTLVAGTFPS